MGPRARRHPLAIAVPNVVMFDSYHCSRYNTNTGRLTAGMFRQVFTAVAEHLGGGYAR